MKKKFVIKAPAAGRSTAELVTHRYLDRETAKAEGRERGTRTIYLGCFSANMDPQLLSGVELVSAGDASHGITLRAGAVIGGQPFVLNAQDVSEIRDWLLQHGGHVRREQRLAELRAERDRELATQRQLLENQIRSEVRETLRAELLAELRPSAAIPSLNAARDALAAAASAVVAEVARLTSEEVRVSAVRSKSAASDESDADALLEATLRLRLDGFSQFEATLQGVGLMKKRGSGNGRKA